MTEQHANGIPGKKAKTFWRAFFDWFTLFSGISTASNLSRTRNLPVVGRGLFLFRKPGKH